MTCKHCSFSVPLCENYCTILDSDGAPACPNCVSNEASREAAGERRRGTGILKPDVVLYNEPHPDAERVGEITQKDLMGARPDLVIVVGTSLKVPGTERLVRELAKVAHPAKRMGGSTLDDEELMMPSSSQQSNASTSSSSGRGRKLKPAPVHVVYLNKDFPSQSSKWRGVFDVWARGDAQEFVALVERERQAEADRVEQRRLKKEVEQARKAERIRLAEKKLQDANVKAKAQGKPTQSLLKLGASSTNPTPSLPVSGAISGTTTTTISSSKKRDPGFSLIVQAPPAGSKPATKRRASASPVVVEEPPAASLTRSKRRRSDSAKEVVETAPKMSRRVSLGRAAKALDAPPPFKIAFASSKPTLKARK